MDAWFEEDDEVFVHARDPYHRIDVLDSSREVRVVVGGQTVAVTRRARFLFETGLPVRYYIPIRGRPDRSTPAVADEDRLRLQRPDQSVLAGNDC